MATAVLARPRLLTAAQVASLAAADLLPKLPAPIVALHDRKRDPTLAELDRYEWWAYIRPARFDRPDAVTGLLAVREQFDLHSNADVISVEYLAGTKRAVHDLVAFVDFLCRDRGLPAIGTIDVENGRMSRFASRFGWRMSRVSFTLSPVL